MSEVTEIKNAPTLAQKSDVALTHQNIKLIALDFDGVFHPAGMQHIVTLTHAFNKTCDAFGIIPEVRTAIKLATKARNQLGMANYIRELTFLTHKNTRDFITHMIEQTHYPNVLPNPTLLKAIKDVIQDIPMCVLSNNYRQHIDKMCHMLFDVGVDKLPLPVYDISKNSDSPMGPYYPKQDPRGFDRLCSDFHVVHNNIVLLDDSPKVIQSARALGVQAYWVTSHEHVPSALYRIRDAQQHSRH